jgi:hypothetical protein
MGLKQIPARLRKKYTIEEREHAVSILVTDFPGEWADIIACLDYFELKKSDVLAAGKNYSPISRAIDSFLRAPARGWAEKKFDTKFVVDGADIPNPTHKIDNFKNRVGLEVEWNNKTEFYDRDLNNFRILRNLKVLSVGVIITRLTELQKNVFNPLGKGKSYGNSTTHWDKLIPKVEGGGAGGCPLLLVGMGMACYRADL